MITPPKIQKVIDQGKANEIAAYITRRNVKYSLVELATLARVCQRFRINQETAKRIIGSVGFLALSSLAYIGGDLPEFVEAGDCPDGWRLVDVVEEIEVNP
jgi:hypothetical protein